MKVARFWARETVDARIASGRRVSVDRWASSDQSAADAQDAARESARLLREKLERGGPLERYPYGVRPLREEILLTLPGPMGRPDAVVTRNGYGCDVLNAARMMFIDIDLPGGKKDQEHERRARERIERFVREQPSFSFRVYRTAAGLRALATHAPLEPTPENLRVLSQLESDPVYLRLCREQACYRARLTPKPWRCGQPPIHIAYPYADAGQAEQTARWTAVYGKRQQAYSTCALLATAGSTEIHPDLQPLVKLHDERTRVGSGLPLA